jgi:hypothetical protein
MAPVSPGRERSGEPPLKMKLKSPFSIRGFLENIDKSAPAGDPRSTWPVKSNQLYLDHSKGKYLFLFCQPWGDIFLKYRKNVGNEYFFHGEFFG